MMSQIMSQVKKETYYQKQIFQNNMTNLEFLQTRARMYSYEVTVDRDKKIHFRKPPITKKALLKLKRGDNLKHFRAEQKPVGAAARCLDCDLAAGVRVCGAEDLLGAGAGRADRLAGRCIDAGRG